MHPLPKIMFNWNWFYKIYTSRNESLYGENDKMNILGFYLPHGFFAHCHLY